MRKLYFNIQFWHDENPIDHNSVSDWIQVNFTSNHDTFSWIIIFNLSSSSVRFQLPSLFLNKDIDLNVKKKFYSVYNFHKTKFFIIGIHKPPFNIINPQITYLHERVYFILNLNDFISVKSKFKCFLHFKPIRRRQTHWRYSSHSLTRTTNVDGNRSQIKLLIG